MENVQENNASLVSILRILGKSTADAQKPNPQPQAQAMISPNLNFGAQISSKSGSGRPQFAQIWAWGKNTKLLFQKPARGEEELNLGCGPKKPRKWPSPGTTTTPRAPVILYSPVCVSCPGPSLLPAWAACSFVALFYPVALFSLLWRRLVAVVWSWPCHCAVCLSVNCLYA